MKIVQRPTGAILETARLDILLAACRVAGYDFAAAVTIDKGPRFADVRFLVALGLKSRGAKQVEACRVARLGQKPYHERRQRYLHRGEVGPTNTPFHADRDPAVVRAALDAAALAIPRETTRQVNLQAAREAIAVAAAEAGLPVADAATGRTKQATTARRRAIVMLRDKPLPWSAIAEGMGMTRVSCMRAYRAMVPRAC